MIVSHILHSSSSAHLTKIDDLFISVNVFIIQWTHVKITAFTNHKSERSDLYLCYEYKLASNVQWIIWVGQPFYRYSRGLYIYIYIYMHIFICTTVRRLLADQPIIHASRFLFAFNAAQLTVLHSLPWLRVWSRFYAFTALLATACDWHILLLIYSHLWHFCYLRRGVGTFWAVFVIVVHSEVRPSLLPIINSNIAN